MGDLSGWQGLLLGVAATIVVSAFFYFKTRQLKRLEFMLTSRRLSDVQHDRLEVRWDGELVRSPFFHFLTLANTGDVEVRADDFDQVLTVTFEGARVLGAEMHGEAVPDGFGEGNGVALEGSVVTVAPFLINPKESFTMLVWTDGEAEPKVMARVAGISELVDIEARARRRRELVLETLDIAVPFRTGDLVRAALRRRGR